MQYADKLCKTINCTRQTLERYICREEFKHIRKSKDENGFKYENITKSDIIRLKELIGNKFNTYKYRNLQD